MRALVIGELEILDGERDEVVSRLLSDGWEVIVAGKRPPHQAHDRAHWHLMDIADERYIYGLRNIIGNDRVSMVVYCGYYEDLQPVKMTIDGLYRRFLTAPEYLAVLRSTCHDCGEHRAGGDGEWQQLQRELHVCRSDIRFCRRGGEEWTIGPEWEAHKVAQDCPYVYPLAREASGVKA